MTHSYQDAFIPILNVSRKMTNSSISNQFLSHKISFKKQTNLNRIIKARKNLHVMKNFSKSKEAAIEIIRNEIIQSKKDWKTSIRTLPSTYRRIISVLIFTSFVLSSWYLVPSRSRYISIAASLLSGGLAFFLSNKINSKNTIGAKSKILEIISSESENFNFPKKLKEIESEFGISKNDLKTEILNIYKKYLLIFLQNSEIRIDEIKELLKLKDLLEISNQEIGECHIEIARILYKEYTINLERKNSDNSNDKVNKFLFLSDRIFSTDTVKGYQYELGRLRKVFLFSNEKILNICSLISYSSYLEIINDSFKNGFYGLEDLDYIKNLIGINTEQQNKIHSLFIKEFVSKLLSEEKKITSEQNIEIEKLITVISSN